MEHDEGTWCCEVLTIGVSHDTGTIEECGTPAARTNVSDYVWYQHVSL